MVKIRRGLLIFLVINIAIIGLLVRSVFTLITLLFEDGARDAILRAEIPAPNSELIVQKPRFIPKIIHQTYVNESIPEVWREAQQSCLKFHEDYEYKLWTDEKSRHFIATEYPWFMDTFDNYPAPIQRADAIRYFVLAYFGGIYIDLDDGCNRRLDPLLSYHAWVRRTVPTGISNDAMGAIKQHPFFVRVIEMLQQYNRNWPLPYVTVMYSTGPLFLSVVWKEYMRSDPTEEGRVRILMPDEYNRHEWSFFTHHRGSSWHGKDAQLIFWVRIAPLPLLLRDESLISIQMGRHWLFLTVLGFATAGLVGLALWWAYSRVFLLGGSVPPKGTLRNSTVRRYPKFWRRLAGKERYDLVENRHEV
ncbi:hypothetical protein GP486_000190 [Trichoglossum hirsutum]|uniref:Mannosyl phosphorylinositol ceramide synthase SUR1 n=1 Tax=Trichoglossum hirsutum TaxID=265104 RepID=A0A9P8LIZ5_9PEZI|nr:hypothetical protein GP486_000190 [Trichoglossum hirsutum]